MNPEQEGSQRPLAQQIERLREYADRLDGALKVTAIKGKGMGPVELDQPFAYALVQAIRALSLTEPSRDN